MASSGGSAAIRGVKGRSFSLACCHDNKIAKVPVVFVGVKFWQPLIDFIKNTLDQEFHTISHEDLELFTLTDDEDEIIEIVKNAPIRESD